MIFSRNLILLTLMFILLAASGSESSEQKENVQRNEYRGFPENVEKQQVEKWKDSKVRLLRSDKQPSVVINAKRAVYEIRHGSRKQIITVIAFSDLKSGTIWVGPEQDAYVEMQGKMLGYRFLRENIIWCRSLLKHDPQATSADITDRVEQDVTGFSLLCAAIPSDERLAEEKPTRLGSHIKNNSMFTDGHFSAHYAPPIVTKFQWDEGLLKLSLTDQTKRFEAAVWIDMKTREIKKVIEKPWSYEEFYKKFGDPRTKANNQ